MIQPAKWQILMNNVPLVAHLVHRFELGGLETLVAECVNRMSPEKYRHVIICVKDYTGFAKKITKPGVEIYSLNKAPGLGLTTHIAIWKLLRKLRPTILHTYNLSAIEYHIAATLAGVPVRVHAEHGREATDPEGKNWRHNLLRRLLIPFIDVYVPVSGDLQRWLRSKIGVPDRKNLLVNNGVDTTDFKPGNDRHSQMQQTIPFSPDCFVVGMVGRIQAVKNHAGLIDAFIHFLALLPEESARLRLAIVGDGPLLPAIREKIAAAGIADLVWLPGARTDIADIMRGLSVFTLSSIAEGTPVTILEAMATGLPVVATRVGGIPEVVLDNLTGIVVPPDDPNALATALATYVKQPELAPQHGAAGRVRIEQEYSMTAMLTAYVDLYDRLCAKKIKARETITSCAE
jgi:sugar transferase (PEP-CTERM/EpsH1 system associated)